MMILWITVIHSRVQEPQQKKHSLHYASTETVGWLGAYFEGNVDDIGTGKGLTCPLYIQEPDCAMLCRQTLTPCIVFCICLSLCLCGLCGLVLRSSENYEKEGCETWSALPFWRSHGLDFFGASRFGVIAVYRWMRHENRKQNQLNPALCVPSVWRACTRLPLILYFKLNTGCQDGKWKCSREFVIFIYIYIYKDMTVNWTFFALRTQRLTGQAITLMH